MKKIIILFVTVLALGTMSVSAKNTNGGSYFKGPGTLNVGFTSDFSNNTLGFGL